MRKVIDGSLTLLLLTTALSLPLMMVSAAGVRAETVIGADGAPGADCPLIDYFCVGGNGGEGESVVATGNPAVAYGGNGGPGGLGAAGGNQAPNSWALAATEDRQWPLRKRVPQVALSRLRLWR